MTHKYIIYGLFGHVTANCNVNSIILLPSSLIPGRRRTKTRAGQSDVTEFPRDLEEEDKFVE